MKPTVVLLVEDQGLVRMVTADILAEEGGYKVIEAVNADEALTFLDVRPDIRVLVTDVDMPSKLNGYALARIVDMRWPGVGIIVSSGVTGPGPGYLPTKARFLAKPYAPSALLRAVSEVMGQASSPIIVPTQEAPVVNQTAPVLPTGIKIDQPHTGIGVDGGLAQPLQEPEK